MENVQAVEWEACLLVDILVTEAVRAALHPGFELRALPPATVKGVREPLVTWTVVEWRPATGSA